MFTNGQSVNNYILDVAHSQKQINVGTLSPGTYQVILICDGQISDTKNISIYWIMRFAFLLFGLIFFQTQEARTQTLGASSLIYETGDSIILKAIAHFSYPEGCCPAMVAHEIDPGTDTIDVKLYYEVNMCVLGSCYTTPEHIFVGVIPPNTKAAVRLYPMENYWVDSNVYDTTFMPQLVWTIPFSWVNNIGREAETEAGSNDCIS